MSGNTFKEEPIAIIGVGCRFSGTATSPEGLWDMLSKGTTGWTKTASHRFNLNAFWHPNGDNKGTFNAKGFHLLKQDPALFDNDFFGIGGLEAKAMDPQQRILLEVAYEAFENAGRSMDELRGSQTGVWCSVSNADYESILARDPDISPGYRMTGTGNAIVSNRISYLFDLRGPSMTIDTFCSSTLVGLDAAVKSIRAGIVQQAFVGGSNLCLDPERTGVLSSMSFTSPDGRCYAFDPRASGYGRGEGVAAVILKPLSAALADGDSIRAVIRGTGVSSDGKTNGITLPSDWGQKQALLMAYEDAGLRPQDTYFVEAHGTGTKAGDRTEATVWMDTFLRGRPKDRPLVVGSVKANLGHTEPTAGLAGLLKAILVLEQGIIPATPTHKSLSPDVAAVLGDSLVQIPTKNTPWPEGMLKRISVNTTGYGGTDAHVIVDHLDEVVPSVQNATSFAAVSTGPKIFTISHRRADALKETAQALRRSLSQRWAQKSETLLSDLAFTLSRRSHWDYRMSFSASTRPELLENLDRIAKGVNRLEAAGSQPALCFAFTGQGAQWPRMGLDLISQYPIFAESMRRSEAEFLRLGAEWHLLEELEKTRDESSVNQAWLSQPCCTAVQVALLDLLTSWEIQPQVVCGHSSGEIAAAYAAGVLTASEALQVAYFRGFHVEALRKSRPDLKGAMLAVGISAEGALAYIEPGDEVTVACYNSPQSATLSGDLDGIIRIKAKLDAQGVFARKLDVDVAYHSSHMKLVEANYHAVMQNLRPKRCKDGVRLYSSVTEEPLDGTEMGASYWTQNLISPVRFSQALSNILTLRDTWLSPGLSGKCIVIELGPHAALKGPITQIIKATGTRGPTIYQNTLKRGENGPKVLLELSGQLFQRGSTVNFRAINEPDLDHSKPKLLVALPKYLWHHERGHWAESRRSAAYRFRAFPKHDILGAPTMDSIHDEPTWKVYLRTSAIPWVKGHVIQDQVVFPGAGYVSMIVEALKERYMIQKRRWKGLTLHFRDIQFTRVLIVPDTENGIETITSLRPLSYSARESSASWYEFRVFTIAADGGASTEHCRGMVSIGSTTVANVLPEISTPRDLKRLSSESFYRELSSLGAKYTGHVAQLNEIRGTHGFARCDFSIPNTSIDMPGGIEQPCLVHPLTLEAAFQSPFAALKLGDKLKTVYLLEGIDELYISTDIPSQPDTSLRAETEVADFGILKARAGVTITDPSQSSEPAYIRAIGVRYAGLETEQQVQEGLDEESICHWIDWVLDPLHSTPQALVKWIRQTAATVNPTMTKTECIVERYCQAAVKHLRMECSKPDTRNKSVHDRLAQLSKSLELDAIPEMSLDLQEKVLATGPLGQAMLDVFTTLSKLARGGDSGLPSPTQGSLMKSISHGDPAIQRSFHHIASYLRILRLKRPTLRILAIGSDYKELKSVVDRLLISSDFANGLRDEDWSCTYADTTPDDTAPSFEPDSSDNPSEYVKLDLMHSLACHNIQPGTFDVLLIPSFLSHSVQDLAAALPRLRSLLKDQGAMVFVEVTEPTIKWELISTSLSNEDRRLADAKFMKVHQWEEVLSKSGFTDLSEVQDFETAEEHETSVLIARALPSGSITSESVTVLLPSEEPDELALDIVSQIRLQTKDASVVVASLESAVVNNGTLIVLLEASKAFLKETTPKGWGILRDFMTTASRVLWITNNGALDDLDPAMSLSHGFTRSLRVEFPNLQLVTLDIDAASKSHAQAAESVCKLYVALLEGNIPAPKRTEWEWEFAERDGAVFVQRAFAHAAGTKFIENSTSSYHPKMEAHGAQARALGLRIHTAGMLNTLHWVDRAEHSKVVGYQEIRVMMKAFSTNSIDISTINGESTGEPNLLTEGVGLVVDKGSQVTDFSIGDIVYAFDSNGLALYSNIGTHKAVKVPQGMNYEEAVTVPLTYGTGFFCLRNLACMQAGETILIHPATNPVGQAAIALSRHLGAGKIFLTASTPDERVLLQKQWNIPAANIFSVEDLESAPEIFTKANGRGVDIVLNCVPSQAIDEISSIVAPFGRLIDVGIQDTRRTGRLQSKNLVHNASYTMVDMALLATAKPALLKEIFAMVLDLVNSSKVQGLEPFTIDPLTEAQGAFQSLLSGSQQGKKILRVGSSMSLMTQPPRPTLAKLRQDGSYLVVGGTGGLGRVIIRFLAQLGARRIITLSPSGNDKVETKYLAEELYQQGVELVSVKGTASDVDKLKTIAQECGLQPVCGVIHAGTVFEDGPFEATTHEQWKRGIEAKVAGTINLYAVFGTTVDFFTMLSSVVGVQGTYAQNAYNTGNSFQDAFARSCAAKGLPARSLNLSMVAGEGRGAQAESTEFLRRHGLRQVDIDTVAAAVSFSICHPIAPIPAEGQILVGFRQEHPDSGSKISALQRPDARFSHIWFKPVSSQTAIVKEGEFDVQSALREAKTAEAAIKATFTGLKGLVSQLLDVEESTILPERNFISYGLDSLTAMELRKYVNTTLVSSVQMLEIMNPTPLMQFAELVAGRSALVGDGLFGKNE
ncbi:polyketide synthase [Dendryphion nanum]|uniref:Polyketide synthase n=1 Tax=Dendryphion nanum TaxID=256645 RepID=A0A9P9I8V1_9PLEO|nr:polyketide synthase [Dendryphion nanum]